MNKILAGQGVGRVENGIEDTLVLTRKCGHPELIFNNNKFKDLYWEVDSAEQWQLSFNHETTNECYICERHKYGLIFFDKCEQN
jgi:hypothetical protein